jgi:16S rRNA (uracil1498-N3)-methyltransferase
MARHTVFIDPDNLAGGSLAALAAGDHLTIVGDEAKHAVRVKRVREGQRVRAIDGLGGVASCIVRDAGRQLALEVADAHREPTPDPFIEICSAAPKGQRLDKMIDMLGQLGVATWRPIDTANGVVEPGAGKHDRMQRIALESAKQSGRARPIAVAGMTALERALDAAAMNDDAERAAAAPAIGSTDTPPDTPPTVVLLLADAEGASMRDVLPSRGPAPGQASGAASGAAGHIWIRVLVGPEGGFEPRERDAAIAAGATPVCLGPHVLRIETAAIAAAAAITALGFASARDA